VGQITVVPPLPIQAVKFDGRAKLAWATVQNTARRKPMISTATHLRFLQLTLCLALCGCGIAEDLVEPVVTPEPAAKVEPKKPDSKEPTAHESKKDPMKSSGAKAEPEQQAFEPPYPNRENLFLAPKRSSVHKDSPGSIQQSVELLGFANVQGPRVILSIDGIVVPMPEGAKQSGIEVISIQPPAVVLQRDRERWQATLEN
jgi:hypothetical protein